MTKFEKELLEELRGIKEELSKSKEPQITFTPAYPAPTFPSFDKFYIGDLPREWPTITCEGTTSRGNTQSFNSSTR